MRGGGAFLCSLDKEALNFVFSLLSHATHKGCNYFEKIPNVKFQNSVAFSVLRYTLLRAVQYQQKYSQRNISLPLLTSCYPPTVTG